MSYYQPYPGIETFYLSLFNQIDTIVDSNGNKIFKNRTIFNNQIDKIKDGKYNSTLFPACFVELKYLNMISLQDNIDGFDIEVIFHIVMFNLNNFYNNSSIGDMMLLIYDYVDYIQRAFVEFWPNPNSGPMNWHGDKEHMHYIKTGNLYEYEVSYLTHYIDLSAYQPYQIFNSHLDLNISLTYSIAPAGIGYWAIQGDPIFYVS